MMDDIIAVWADVAIPAPPALQPVRVDTATTGLLLLDFNRNNCNADRRPRCFHSIPKVARLLTAARARGMAVGYATTPTGSVEDVPPDLAPLPSDPVVRAGVDKFLGTVLEEALRSRNVRALIVTGTAAHGAVLYTASAAALRGFEVVVPVDGMSADDLFAELLTAWELANAPPSVSRHITLTRCAMIAFDETTGRNAVGLG
jgi:nicotinamidase-related amidase